MKPEQLALLVQEYVSVQFPEYCGELLQLQSLSHQTLLSAASGNILKAMLQLNEESPELTRVCDSLYAWVQSFDAYPRGVPMDEPVGSRGPIIIIFSPRLSITQCE
jgi:hypothetical protein